MTRRVLITGVSGFLGSRLAIRFSRAGYDVIATSRRPTAELEGSLGVPVSTLDVLDDGIAGQPITADLVIHCATPNDVLSRDVKAGIDLAVHGARNVLDLALNAGARRFIFFSTLQVYGTELTGEIDENTPIKCESPYALNHFLGEEVCRFYARRDGIAVALLRPANVFGVPDARTVNRTTLVPMCFVIEVIATAKITLRSSGRQTRNFVSTDDVANACLHIADHMPSGTSALNLGSHWAPSIFQIAEMVAEVYFARTGRQCEIRIESAEPITGNAFAVASRLGLPSPLADISRATMWKVIHELFDYFKS